jgi:hypothetical protein
MRKALFSLVLLGVAVIALGQEECCPDRTHTVGVGLSWILPNDVFITARFWISNRSAIELSLMEPIFRGFTQVRISTVRTVNDFCIARPFVSGGLTLPIGNINWQRMEGLLGLEWCFTQDTTISFIGGVYLLHYYGCCAWYPWGECKGWCWLWGWGTLFSINFHYYFTGLIR